MINYLSIDVKIVPATRKIVHKRRHTTAGFREAQMYRKPLPTIALLALMLLIIPVLANEQTPELPEGALKFSKPKAALYDALFIFDEDNKTGGGAELKSNKHRFLHLRVLLNYKIPEDVDNVNVNSNQISLVETGGKTHPSVGSYDQNDVFSEWADNLWLHSNNRRRNKIIDIVYAIPVEAKGPYALVIGDLKTLRVDLPKQVTAPPHASQMVKVKVRSVAWGESVPGEPIRIGNNEIKTTFKVPGRRILAVSILVDAHRYNDTDGKTLNWSGSNLSLRDKEGQIYTCHGGFWNGHLQPNIGHRAEVGTTTTDAETFFFSPPDDIESFEVLWFGRPVTEYQFKK